MANPEPSEIHLTLPPQVVQPGATTEEARRLRAVEDSVLILGQQGKAQARTSAEQGKTLRELVIEFAKFKKYALVGACIIFAGGQNGGKLFDLAGRFFQ